MRVRGKHPSQQWHSNFHPLGSSSVEQQAFPHDWTMLSWNTQQQFTGTCKPPWSCHQRITKGPQVSPEKSHNSYLKILFCVTESKVTNDKPQLWSLTDSREAASYANPVAWNKSYNSPHTFALQIKWLPQRIFQVTPAKFQLLYLSC